MITNQIMKRPLANFKVEQRTKDGMFNATALLKQRNKANGLQKVISLKELNQEFFTNKSLQAYLGGVSKDFIADLREKGELPYYKVRNTIFYKVADVRRMMDRHKVK